MKVIRVSLIFLLITFLIGCSAITGNDDSSKKKEEDESKKTIAFKTDLFNQTENLVKKIKNKEYIDAENTIMDIHKATNKLGITEDSEDESSVNYLKSLNTLSSDIKKEANNQKLNTVYYEYEKSQLNIISSIQGGGNNNAQSNNQMTGSSTSQSDKQDSGNQSSGSSSSEKESSSSSSNQQSDTIIIPEEELVNNYPELTETENDKKLEEMAVSLLDYITDLMLKDSSNKINASINRLKYYIYKVNSLSKLENYEESGKQIEKAQKLWEEISMDFSEKNTKTDIANIKSIFNNLTSTIKQKNSTAIDMQCQIAIESLDKLEKPSS